MSYSNVFEQLKKTQAYATANEMKMNRKKTKLHKQGLLSQFDLDGNELDYESYKIALQEFNPEDLESRMMKLSLKYAKKAKSAPDTQ